MAKLQEVVKEVDTLNEKKWNLQAKKDLFVSVHSFRCKEKCKLFKQT